MSETEEKPAPKIIRRLDTQEAMEFWEFVDRRTAATESWPEWKKRDEGPANLRLLWEGVLHR